MCLCMRIKFLHKTLANSCKAKTQILVIERQNQGRKNLEYLHGDDTNNM